MPSGNRVLVVGELAGNGLPRAVAWEMMTAARTIATDLGGEVVALSPGAGDRESVHQWASAGADCLVIADVVPGELTPGVAAAVLRTVIVAVDPAVVLVPGTTLGRDYAPLVAARLECGLAADCIEFAVVDSALTAVRPVLGGRATSRVVFPDGRLAMATVRAGSFAKAEPGATEPAVEALALTLTDSDLRVQVTATTPKGSGGSRLDSAEIVVSGGRGLKDSAQFVLVEELAAALGGAVGATRAVVDAGWRPHHEQIGQTGRTVSPKLYVAVGISGAVQHNVGMQGSDRIVAINRDPDAPIFKIASFGIVGDLFEIVPALTAEIRNVKG